MLLALTEMSIRPGGVPNFGARDLIAGMNDVTEIRVGSSMR